MVVFKCFLLKVTHYFPSLNSSGPSPMKGFYWSVSLISSLTGEAYKKQKIMPEKSTAMGVSCPEICLYQRRSYHSDSTTIMDPVAATARHTPP
jgi:hypothetical protein